MRRNNTLTHFGRTTTFTGIFLMLLALYFLLKVICGHCIVKAAGLLMLFVDFFRYEAHYGIPIGRKKSKKDVEPAEDDVLAKKKSNHLVRKLEERRKEGKAKVDPHVEEQFLTGRLLGKVLMSVVFRMSIRSKTFCFVKG